MASTSLLPKPSEIKRLEENRQKNLQTAVANFMKTHRPEKGGRYFVLYFIGMSNKSNEKYIISQDSYDNSSYSAHSFRNYEKYYDDDGKYYTKQDIDILVGELKSLSYRVNLKSLSEKGNGCSRDTFIRYELFIELP